MSKKEEGNGCFLVGCLTYVLIQIGIMSYLIYRWTFKGYIKYSLKSIFFSVVATLIILLISYVFKLNKKKRSIDTNKIDKDELKENKNVK